MTVKCLNTDCFWYEDGLCSSREIEHDDDGICISFAWRK